MVQTGKGTAKLCAHVLCVLCVGPVFQRSCVRTRGSNVNAQGRDANRHGRARQGGGRRKYQGGRVHPSGRGAQDCAQDHVGHAKAVRAQVPARAGGRLSQHAQHGEWPVLAIDQAGALFGTPDPSQEARQNDGHSRDVVGRPDGRTDRRERLRQRRRALLGAARHLPHHPAVRFARGMGRRDEGA